MKCHCRCFRGILNCHVSDELIFICIALRNVLARTQNFPLIALQIVGQKSHENRAPMFVNFEYALLMDGVWKGCCCWFSIFLSKACLRSQHAQQNRASHLHRKFQYKTYIYWDFIDFRIFGSYNNKAHKKKKCCKASDEKVAWFNPQQLNTIFLLFFFCRSLADSLHSQPANAAEAYRKGHLAKQSKWKTIKLSAGIIEKNFR